MLLVSVFGSVDMTRQYNGANNKREQFKNENKFSVMVDKCCDNNKYCDGSQ